MWHVSCTTWNLAWLSNLTLCLFNNFAGRCNSCRLSTTLHRDKLGAFWCLWASLEGQGEYDTALRVTQKNSMWLWIVSFWRSTAQNWINISLAKWAIRLKATPRLLVTLLQGIFLSFKITFSQIYRNLSRKLDVTRFSYLLNVHTVIGLMQT